MKAMKKLFLMMLVAIMVLSTIACNGNNDSTSDNSANGGEQLSPIERIMKKYDDKGYVYEYDGDPCTITMSQWDADGATIERSVVEAMLSGFKKRYPTIEVQLDIVNDYENTYATRFAAGNVHDVFMVSDGVFPSWVKMNVMEDLTDWIETSDLVKTDKIIDSALTRYQYDPATRKLGEGIQYVLPKDISAHVMYYNKDLFDEYGVEYPSSTEIMKMDDAINMWKALTNEEDGVYGLAWTEIQGWIWSAGGDYLNEARTAFPEDEASINALRQGYKFIQDAYYNYGIAPTTEAVGDLDATKLFALGTVATCVAGSWKNASFSTCDFNWDIAYVPAYEQAPTKNGWSGSVGYGLYKKSANIEAAWKLLEYINSEEGQEILASTGFQFPIYKELGLSEEYIANEKAKAGYPQNYEIYIKSAINQPAGTSTYIANNTWKSTSYDAYSAYLLDSVEEDRWSVDKFLDEVRAKINSIL